MVCVDKVSLLECRLCCRGGGGKVIDGLIVPKKRAILHAWSGCAIGCGVRDVGFEGGEWSYSFMEGEGVRRRIKLFMDAVCE
mmetsp:Transcript_29002/g.43142  ORF Transcript_29002/g.43142 Transcript_29002/m.43142 type:complete len:82 (+) Transcript_29002:806-1051(+)